MATSNIDSSIPLQVHAPDTFGRLNQILGVKQQQQALQTGQYEQATAKATSEQADQRNRELQYAQKLAIDGAKSGAYNKPDGYLDRIKLADDISRVAPTYGGEVATQLLSQANEVVQNQRAHQALTVDRKKEIGDTLGSLAADPQVDTSKVIDAIETLRQAHNGEPEYSRLLTSMTAHMPPTASPQQLQQLLGRLAAAAVAEPQTAPSTIDTGTSVKTGTTNKYTGEFTQSGGGASAGGGSVPKDLGGAAAATGGAKLDVDRADQVSSSIQPATSAIQLSKEIDDLAEQVQSGKIANWVSNAAASAGLGNVAMARQLLRKDLGQLKTQAGASAGSDQRLQTILSGYPEETSASGTIHTAMDYIRGSFRQNLARGKQLNAYKEKNKGSTLGFQHADDVLTSQTDPLMHEYMALGNRDEQKEFFLRNFKNKEEAKAFRDRVDGVRHALGQ